MWAVVSYFGLFDLGLGRALTQKLAIELSRESSQRVAPLACTALALLCTLGLLAGMCMALAAVRGIHLIKAVPDQNEVLDTVYWMAVAMPFIVITSGLRGILEACHRFATINLIRFPMGLFTFLAPAGVVAFGSSRLDHIACALALGRILACLVHGWYALKELPSQMGKKTFDMTLIKPLCVSGGWMTVSNVIGPMMGYLDRFVVGALTSAQMVAIYATPQELISKLSILPAALMSTMFPQFARHIGSDSKQASDSLRQCSRLTHTLCIPTFAFFSLFSHEILSLWIGREFASQAGGILSIMACGMLINSLAFIPLTWLQARDNSNAVARIHAMELPLFCLMLAGGLSLMGLAGAALAWAARIVIDAVLLWITLGKTEPVMKTLSHDALFKSLGTAGIIWVLSTADIQITLRVPAFIAITAFFGHRLHKMTRQGRI